jgi:hypothetical protein
MKGDTHNALLLNLGAIEPCLHEKEKVYYNIQDIVLTSNPPQLIKSGWKCQCGAEVEPVVFAEKKK